MTQMRELILVSRGRREGREEGRRMGGEDGEGGERKEESRIWGDKRATVWRSKVEGRRRGMGKGLTMRGAAGQRVGRGRGAGDCGGAGEDDADDEAESGE